MKKIIVTIVLSIFAFVNVSSAQETENKEKYQAKKIKVSGGRSAITSGLDIKIMFQKENKLLGAQVNYQRVYGIYGYQLPFKTTALITGGFFKNTPWIGPEIIINPTKRITLMGWYGHGLHKEGEKFGWNPQSFFTYVGIFFDLSPITLSYAIQEFNGWMNLPGIKYSLKINNHSMGFIGLDYLIEDSEPLFRIGLDYTF